MDKDRVSFRDHIYSQIIDQMKNLIERSLELKEMSPDYANLEVHLPFLSALYSFRAIRFSKEKNEMYLTEQSFTFFWFSNSAWPRSI